jgi:ubiquinone/menaquinone biosynthesis C-methylase UbiE
MDLEHANPVTEPEGSTFDRLAAPYDRGMAPLERLWLQQMRLRLVPHARGRVLEIGVGTGVNIPLYPSSAHVTGIDESADMLDVAAQRSTALARHLQFSQMDAQRLAFCSGHFDTVIATLVLCSVVDQSHTLDEIRRVMRKPGGRLLLLEHMRPSFRPLAWLVDVANLPWFACNGRCHLNRKTQQTVVAAGFRLRRVEAAAGGFLRLIIAQPA